MFEKILGEAFPIIRDFAPKIADAIGSPVLGTATKWGISILSHAFDVQPDEIHTLGTTIMNTDNASSKLQSLEETFGEWLKSGNHILSDLTKAEVNVKLEWNKNTIPVPGEEK